MSGDYTHAQRPADAGPEQFDAPAPELAAPTPSAVPVAGVARTAPRPTVRRGGTVADPLGGTAAGSDVVDALRRRRGGGSPLPEPVARQFGEQLGTDLSAVRVHTDWEADRISRSVGAEAFTHGTDVYFTSGRYQTGGSGQRLLAHELAHVAQNAAGQFASTTAGTEIGRADHPAEKDADQTADRVVSALRRSPGPAPDASDAADPALAGIRRNVAELTKWHEEKIAHGGGNAYASELKDADRPDGAYSVPDLGEEKEDEAEEGGGRPDNAYASELKGADRPDGAYSVPELNEAKDGGGEGAGPAEGGEHAAKVYSEFKPGDPGRPANAYAGEIGEEKDGRPAGAYSVPDLNDAAGEEKAEGDSGGDAGGPENSKLEAALEEGDKEEEEKAKAEHRPGDSRKHRGWLLSKLDRAYANEKGQSKQGFAPVLEPHLTRIKLYWDSLQEIDRLPSNDSDGYAAKAGELCAAVKARIAALPGNFGKDFHDKVKAYAMPALTTALVAEHAHCKQWLLRQDLPVRNDGTLDLKKIEVVKGDGTKEMQYDMSSRKVQYMEEEERAAAKVAFVGGVLKRDPNWKPSTKTGAKSADKKEASATGGSGKIQDVDTKDSVTHFTGPGWEIFVVSPDGEIYMTSHKIGMTHHSSLLGGGDVLLGGEIKAANGRILEMTNKSGHYLPTPEQLAQFLHFLEKDGISVDFNVSGFGLPKQSGKKLLEGALAAGGADPTRTFDAMKTMAVFKAYVADPADKPQVLAILAEQGWHLDADEKQFLDAKNERVDFATVRKTLKEKLGKAKRTVVERNMGAKGPQTREITHRA